MFVIDQAFLPKLALVHIRVNFIEAKMSYTIKRDMI